MMKKKKYVEFRDCILRDTCPEETLLHLFLNAASVKAFGGGLKLNGILTMISIK
jgi:hypothetical protein